MTKRKSSWNWSWRNTQLNNIQHSAPVNITHSHYCFLLQRNVLRLRLIFWSHCTYSSFKTKFDVEKQTLWALSVVLCLIDMYAHALWSIWSLTRTVTLNRLFAFRTLCYVIEMHILLGHSSAKKVNVFTRIEMCFMLI